MSESFRHAAFSSPVWGMKEALRQRQMRYRELVGDRPASSRVRVFRDRSGRWCYSHVCPSAHPGWFAWNFAASWRETLFLACEHAKECH
ncbi:hypothetical protein [Streptomyces sp. URMC 129]|uniref:hypothetical protein n=1 Tax=Streptomyces sp. URMC 129 TaxID=3423407 RepID=UPI003F1E1E08